MINKDFKVDFKNKKIFHNPKGSRKKYTQREFYSFLQGIFDNPENMRYDIPIKAVSKTEFKLINNWKIDKEARKNLLKPKNLLD